MDRAAEIKSRVSMLDVIERYGYETNRAGFMRCPFHSGDHTASLKIYPGERGWHCFGCGKGGSVIDFVMEHDGLSFKDACKTLDSMFGLSLYGEISLSQYRRIERERIEAEERRERRRAEQEADFRCRNILNRYFRWLWLKPEKTEAMLFDLEYLERLMEQEGPLLFDSIARVNALISKHIDRGEDYSCVREVRPDDGTGACP